MSRSYQIASRSLSLGFSKQIIDCEVKTSPRGRVNMAVYTLTLAQNHLEFTWRRTDGRFTEFLGVPLLWILRWLHCSHHISCYSTTTTTYLSLPTLSTDFVVTAEGYNLRRWPSQLSPLASESRPNSWNSNGQSPYYPLFFLRNATLKLLDTMIQHTRPPRPQSRSSVPPPPSTDGPEIWGQWSGRRCA